MTPDELRDESAELRAEAEGMTDALQDYIYDQEYEIGEMLAEAASLEDEARDIERVMEHLRNKAISPEQMRKRVFYEPRSD